MTQCVPRNAVYFIGILKKLFIVFVNDCRVTLISVYEIGMVKYCFNGENKYFIILVCGKLLCVSNNSNNPKHKQTRENTQRNKQRRESDLLIIIHHIYSKTRDNF